MEYNVMSTLKVASLRNPTATSNNIVLNADGSIETSTGGSFTSNNYVAGTFTSNNYVAGTFTSNNYVQTQLSEYRTGEIIEHIESVCDGSTVNGVTFPTVTTTQLVNTTSYVDLTGTEITYTPPAGTDRVIYTFLYGSDSGGENDSHSTLQFQLNVDSAGYTTVGDAEFGHGSYFARPLVDQFSWPVVVNTGVSDDYTNGKLNAATPTIQFKIRVKVVATNRPITFHTGNGFHKPRIRIQAIAA
jgi:hypothetical protein